MAKRLAKQRALKRKRIPGYTPEAETAEELNVSVRLLRKWRQLGLGPPYVEIARQYHYGDAARMEWVRSQEVHPARSSQAA